MPAKDASSESPAEYKERILRYQAGADPLVLQAKAPFEKLSRTSRRTNSSAGIAFG